MQRQLLVPEVTIIHPLVCLNWWELPELPVGFKNAKATWLDGQLYFGGGVTEGDGGVITTLFCYSSNSTNYTTIQTPVSEFALATFDDHAIIIGGKLYPGGEVTNKVWTFDHEGRIWKDDIIPAMPTRRSAACAATVNYLLIVAGGYNEGIGLRTVEVYDIRRRIWRTVESLPQPSYHMTCTVHDGHVYFSETEKKSKNIYYAAVDSLITSSHWKVIAGPQQGSSVTSLGHLISIGGGGPSSQIKSDIFAFHSYTQSWLHIGNIPAPLFGTCICISPRGELIMIGGAMETGYSNRAFKAVFSNEVALGLASIILKGVQSGLLATVERALAVVKEHFQLSQLRCSLLLDFLAHSSSPNVSSIEHSCSPLMIACDNEDTKMVDVLLKNGASPAYKNKDDVTALHVACSKDNLKLVQRLVRARQLTQQATNLLQMTDKNGLTVFHYACGSHFGRETLKWLLQNKTLCDMLNKRTKTGYTPLLTACHNANVAAVEVLVTHDRVDTALCDENNQGALHLAAMHDSSAIVELLLKKGYPTDTQDSEGNTALHIAYKKSSISVITVLTRVDGGRIELIMNKAGQRPADIEPDDIIPAEILKKGAKAVQLYFEALIRGKKLIPRCNLLILGEERVGKTSLYHLLVQKPFITNQDSTRGIDNTIVDTRHVGTEDWAEKDQHTVEQHADQQFVQGVIEALPSDLFAQSDSPTPTVTESELQDEISKLEPEIQQILTTKKNPPRPTKKHSRLTKVQPTLPEERAASESQVPEKTSGDSHTQPEAQLSELSHSTNGKDPSTTNQSTLPARAVPKVSSRHAKLIDQELMAAASKEKKEPVLLLNTLDFAGQKQYRPMHHCFISRRAMYLVVFNLQHVIQYLEQKSLQSVPSGMKVSNPFEEIRYWLHSIHAHTLPAVPGKDNRSMKNVCLVGTHRTPPDKSKRRHIEDDELEKINDVIMNEIYTDDRCFSHLHLMGPNVDRVFIAVENSMEDREASGAKALQNEIETMSQRLPFLGEEYPVIWFRFDSELTRLKESLKRKKSSLVVKEEEVLKIATHCGITDRYGQLLALEFFHETGKIVCLKFLPPLFISQQEYAELEELVLLDPTWLIHVMMNVVELNYRSSIEGKHLNQLRETGVASSDLLKEAWSGYLQEPIGQSFRQMCLMLQAEALIHPIRIIPKSALDQSPSESVPNLETQLPSTLPTTSEAATADEKLEYLVPGKLPEKIKEGPVKCSRWTMFYFDFQTFLPEEIYHRLLCLLLAVSQLDKSIDKPYLSQNICQFSNIDGVHLSIELESEHHRLKISVLSRCTDVRSPTHHIDTIHTQYLRKICTHSNLEGLRYVGGPLLDPCMQCGGTNVVRYVCYYEGQNKPSESACPKCLKTYDVNLLLTDPVKDQSEGATLPDIPLTVEKHHAVLYDVLNSHAYRWRDIGLYLRLLPSDLDNIQANPLLMQNAPKSWLNEMFRQLLEKGGAKLSMLEAALNKTGLGVTAQHLRRRVEVQRTPTITGHPQGQEKTFGEKVSLSVTANGMGDISYKWKKDDHDINTSTYPCCEGAITKTLTITCALPLYTGHYNCIVRNEFGEIESQTAELEVLRISGPKLTEEELQLISKMLSEENELVKLNQIGINFQDEAVENLTIQEVYSVLSSLDISKHVVENLTAALDNLKHYQAYQLALKRGATISIRYLKFLFYGPPRAGKTSARRRLVGEILNLESDKNQLSISTGTAEGTNVIVQQVHEQMESTTALLTTDKLPHKWTAVKSLSISSGETDLEDEMLVLYKFIHEETQEPKSQQKPTELSQTDSSVADAKSSSKSKSADHDEPELSHTTVIETKSRDHDEQLQTQQEPTIQTVSQESTTSSATVPRFSVKTSEQLIWKQTIRKAFAAFDNILKSKKRNEYLDILLTGTSLINMVDTGGQPAFLEMLPVLTVGPAMYLVFFNLTQQLLSRYDIRYATDDGEISLSTSSYTIQEVIFQILSSIAAFSRIQGIETFPDSSQAALIVGTHKDQLDSAALVEKDIAVQRELNQVLQTDSGLLCRASEESLILAIDNMTGDEQEVKTMRKRLEEIIEDKFRKHDIPAAWLMINIFLRKLGMRVMSLDQCKDIARKLHVTDIEEALWFLHHIVGSLMYFPKVEELKDLVICDPQVVFDSVTTLIIQTFNTANLVDGARKRFKETGLFSDAEIAKAVTKCSNEYLPPAKLINLLEYLNIVAPITTDSHCKASKWYFFPAILSCATNEQLHVSKKPNDPLPLMIHFKFGFVPMGLFCATIASLVSQIYSEKLTWFHSMRCYDAPDNEPLYKNKHTFRTGNTYDITLISRPKRLEVHLTQTENAESSQIAEQCCARVLDTICDTLDIVISQIKHLNLTTSTDEAIYQLGFKCLDDLMLNKPKVNTSDSVISRSPKLLWYSFLESSSNSCFQCLNSGEILSKKEVLTLKCHSWFGRMLLFTEHPKSQSKVYGDEVMFEVSAVVTSEAERKESLIYQWFKDNTEITLETHPYCRGANECSLHISAVLAQYEGKYKCVVHSQDGNVVHSNDATLEVVTPVSWLLGKCSGSISDSVTPPIFNEPRCQLLPLVPPSLEVIDCKGKVLLGPDKGITITVPPRAVADNDKILFQIQSFIPATNDAIVLPEDLKLFSPIYQISSFSGKFLKNVQLSMSHYAKLLSRRVVSGLMFLHSTDKEPPYKFTELSGGEFRFESCSGTIHLQTFCKIALAGRTTILEEYVVYFIHPFPKLDSKCMCALFSACYRHHAYLKYLEDEMVKKYPQATFVTAAAFHHVELAEDSKEFELIIPHEDIRKQGYVVNVSPHKTTKILVKDIPQVSAKSADYPFTFPLPCRALYVEPLHSCPSRKSLECDLVLSGAKEDHIVFVLRADSSFIYVSETQDKSDCDWSDIVGYLYKLDRSLTLRLGGELGLDNFKLTNMKDLPGDMVTALLRKQDKVKEKCGDTVTWQVLINALLKIGQTGIANDILKEKCGQNTSGLAQQEESSAHPTESSHSQRLEVAPVASNNTTNLEGFSPKMSRPCFIKWLKSKHEVPEKDCTVLEGNGINVKVFATLEKQNLQELGISFGGKRILTSLVPIIRNAIRH